MTTITKTTKRIVRNLYKNNVKQGEDRLAYGLTQADRAVSSDEGYTEYGYLTHEDVLEARSTFGEGEEGLRAWFEDARTYSVHSPYDCTGEPFTKWFTLHVNPCGVVSFTHAVGYDF